MVVIISVVFLLIYITTLLLLKGGVIFFGVDYIFTFFSLLMSYAVKQPYLIPYYDFTVLELSSLKTGVYIQSVFFLIFTILGFALKIAEPDISNKELKIKRTLSWIVFAISMLPLFGALNNYSEIERQNKLMTYYGDVTFTESDTNIIFNNSLLLNIEQAFYEKENKRVIVSKGDYSFELKELIIDKKEQYIDILKKRFSYNLNIKQFKETLFKKNSALVIEYYLNKDYNRDYVVRVDQRFFVLSLRATQETKELALKEFKDFLIYSVYLYKE